MPLFRVPAGENVKFSWKNKHSGSVFNLNHDTEYEIKLQLKDPDGGVAEKFLEEYTRPVPHIGSKAEIIELETSIMLFLKKPARTSGWKLTGKNL